MKIRFAVGSHAVSSPELANLVDGLESSGFDGIWLSDLPIFPALDPMLALAFAAGRTSRLKLGANVVPFGRNPFLLAKELAQLDQLSAGRLLLNFVQGVDERESRVLGDADGTISGRDGGGRGAALEEVVGLLRRWWAGEVIDASSDYGCFIGVVPPARPAQEPLEIWLGGRGPKALERAGRIADGWLGASLTAQEAGVARRRIEEWAGRSQRTIDSEHFGINIAYGRQLLEPEMVASIAARRPDLDPRELVPAGAGALRSMICRYVDSGISKFVLRALTRPISWVEELSWLTDAVLDLQT